MTFLHIILLLYLAAISVVALSLGMSGNVYVLLKAKRKHKFLHIFPLHVNLCVVGMLACALVVPLNSLTTSVAYMGAEVPKELCFFGLFLQILSYNTLALTTFLTTVHHIFQIKKMFFKPHILEVVITWATALILSIIVISSAASSNLQHDEICFNVWNNGPSSLIVWPTQILVTLGSAALMVVILVIRIKRKNKIMHYDVKFKKKKVSKDKETTKPTHANVADSTCTEGTVLYTSMQSLTPPRNSLQPDRLSVPSSVGSWTSRGRRANEKASLSTNGSYSCKRNRLKPFRVQSIASLDRKAVKAHGAACLRRTNSDLNERHISILMHPMRTELSRDALCKQRGYNSLQMFHKPSRKSLDTLKTCASHTDRTQTERVSNQSVFIVRSTSSSLDSSRPSKSLTSSSIRECCSTSCSCQSTQPRTKRLTKRISRHHSSSSTLSSYSNRLSRKRNQRRQIDSNYLSPHFPYGSKPYGSLSRSDRVFYWRVEDDGHSVSNDPFSNQTSRNLLSYADSSPPDIPNLPRRRQRRHRHQYWKGTPTSICQLVLLLVLTILPLPNLLLNFIPAQRHSMENLEVIIYFRIFTESLVSVVYIAIPYVFVLYFKTTIKDMLLGRK